MEIRAGLARACAAAERLKHLRRREQALRNQTTGPRAADEFSRPVRSEPMTTA